MKPTSRYAPAHQKLIRMNQELARMNQNLVQPAQTITSQLIHEIIPVILTILVAVVISFSAFSIWVALA